MPVLERHVAAPAAELRQTCVVLACVSPCVLQSPKLGFSDPCCLRNRLVQFISVSAI